MKRLSIFFAALMVCTLSFAQTDYSTTYTSNVTLTAGTNASAAKIVIGDNTYDGVKAGTASKTGVISITVPANMTNLHIHAIAWKGVTDASVSITSGTEGVTCTPAALTLANNAGITGNSPFTISGDMLEDYYFNVALTGVKSETTLTLTCGKRFVVFGVNAVAAQTVEATDIALDQTTLELKQYKSAKLVATLTPATATTAVEWKSSNEKVATVGSNGVVTAVGIGTANITATAGEYVATCAVTVSAATIYSCSEIVDLAKDLANNEVLANGKYIIRGYVTEIVGAPSSDMEKYGNYSVWMADTKDGGKVFEAYAAAPVDGETIAEVGDFVEIIGDITNFNGTIETNKGTATIKILKFDVVAVANDKTMGIIEGEGTYAYNTEITLTAIPNDGYEFVNWTDAEGNVVSTEASYKFTVTEDIILQANFQAVVVADIQWVLNGGNYNVYNNAKNKAELFYAFMTDNGTKEKMDAENATYESLLQYAAYNASDPVKGTGLGRYMTTASALGLPQWAWLKDYLNATKGSDMGDLTGAVARYEVSAFWMSCQNKSFPKSSDYTVAGTDAAYMPAMNAAGQYYSYPETVSETYTLPTPTKLGATFLGWFDNEKCEGDALTTIPANYAGTLYASWKEVGTDVEDINATGVEITKIVRNGQVLIIRDGNIYDMLGQIVE